MSQNTESNQTSTATDVLAEVANALRGSAGELRTRLVKTLTERELVKRADLLDKALVKLGQLKNEVNAIRPPGKKAFVLQSDGKMVEAQAVYTADEKKKFDEEMKQYNKKLKEANEKLSKFEKLLESAFTGAPEELEKAYAKLGKAVAGGGGGGGDSDDSEKSEE